MEASTKLKKGEANPFVESLLEDAEALSEELRGKGGLYERIGANRDTLRQIKTTGFLSKAQAKKVDEYYPERKAKASDAPASEGNSTPTADEGNPAPANQG